MNHAVMTEIDIEKKIKQLLKNKNYFVSVTKPCLRRQKMIRKAFDVSVEAHKDQRRKSRSLYFPSHCRGKIVASEIGLGATSIAALLHDVVEDTPTTVKT
jgi:GTP pyrophosphokinase